MATSSPVALLEHRGEWMGPVLNAAQIRIPRRFGGDLRYFAALPCRWPPGGEIPPCPALPGR
jgi:hypothetical protein